MVAVTHLADIARSQNTRAAFWDKSCFAGLIFSRFGIIMRDKCKRLTQNYKDIMSNLSSFQLDVYSSGAAFFIFISVIPFIMIVLYIITHTSISQPDIVSFLESYMPADFELVLITIINDIFNRSKAVLPLSIIACIWSSSRGIMAITKGLNKINYVEETRNYFLVRILSSLYTVFLVAGVLIMITLGAFGRRIFHIISSEYDEIHYLISMLFNNSDLILLVVVFIMFMFMYIVLPARHIAFKRQIPGALIAAVIWILFTRLFSYYINNYNAYSIYGSLAFVIVFLVWIYAGIYFMFIGAWINYRLSLK